MALGGFSSVGTQNQQIDAEVRKEKNEIVNNSQAEISELASALESNGLRPSTALQAAQEIHQDTNIAVNVHIMHELGVNPQDVSSPLVVAISSFFAFALGAIIPLIPFFFGAGNIYPGLILRAVGLIIVGAVGSLVAGSSPIKGALKQLFLGALATGVTFSLGSIFGTVVG